LTLIVERFVTGMPPVGVKVVVILTYRRWRRNARRAAAVGLIVSVTAEGPDAVALPVP
jgi:hypothetical protein